MIKIETKSAKSLIQAVRQSISQENTMKWMKETADPYMRSIFSEQFSKEGSRFGNGWHQLAPATVASRKKMRYARGVQGGSRRSMSGFGDAHPILVRTRELFNKVTKTHGIITKTMASVTITWGKFDNWFGADKYAIHQGGTSKIPARPMIGATDGDKKHLARSYYGFMGNIIRWKK